MNELMAFERFNEDNNWFIEKYPELQNTYGDKFVAIFNKKIISVADNVEEIVKKVKEKGIDISEILIEKVVKKGVVVIL